jgi:AcrR family transcriptional regulator
MPRPKSNRKQQLTDVAVGVTYRQGFRQTTLANVAEAGGVPLGSVYYYFKSKDQLGAAVIDRLAEQYETLRDGWDSNGEPRAAISAFIDMTIGNGEALSRFGCPIGSLASELGKSDEALARSLADVFRRTRGWMQTKFEALGFAPQTASGHALHVLTVLEGASLLSHMFSSPEPIEAEGNRLKKWLAEVSEPKTGNSNDE